MVATYYCTVDNEPRLLLLKQHSILNFDRKWQLQQPLVAVGNEKTSMTMKKKKMMTKRWQRRYINDDDGEDDEHDEGDGYV